MKTRLLLIAFALFNLSSVSAQLSGLLPTQNEKSELIRAKGIRKCTIVRKTYKSGQLEEEYLDEIDKYDKQGYFISDQSFSSDGSEFWYVTYTYDKQHRLTKEETQWFEEEWDKDIYTYDRSGRLIRIDKYERERKNQPYEWVRAELISYKGDRIDLITNNRGDTLYYFVYQGNKAYKLITAGGYVSVYENGNILEYVSEKDITYYEYSVNGYLQHTVRKDRQGNTLRESNFYYVDGLLSRINSYDDYGNLISSFEYTYK